MMNPISLDRITSIPPTEAINYACYLCGFLVLDPRVCTATLKQPGDASYQIDNTVNNNDISLINNDCDNNKVTCNTIFCHECLRAYLINRPFCPKCRSESFKEQFKRPAYEKYKYIQQEILVKCQHQIECKEMLNLKQFQLAILNESDNPQQYQEEKEYLENFRKIIFQHLSIIKNTSREIVYGLSGGHST
eukprot:403334695